MPAKSKSSFPNAVCQKNGQQKIQKQHAQSKTKPTPVASRPPKTEPASPLPALAAPFTPGAAVATPTRPLLLGAAVPDDGATAVVRMVSLPTEPGEGDADEEGAPEEDWLRGVCQGLASWFWVKLGNWVRQTYVQCWSQWARSCPRR